MQSGSAKVLDFNERHETTYCIPLWLRDEQIKSACARSIPRIQPDLTPKSDPIAVVCFGPSLQDTWEEIKAFKYVITCSGAHKFLIERGIIPTWHVEVDPRAHKIVLLGLPHPDVHYLPASTCHPTYFDHILSGAGKVSLWHVFSDDSEAHRILPRGEWAITGGSNVGLRAMTIARFFGYKNQHVFGMDGCQRETKHAAPHPLQDGSGYSLVTYEGVEYKTTPAMLESAKQTFHELDMMSDVEVTFHGEGLVQEMSKRYQRKKKDQALIAFNRPELISAEYRDANRKFHESRLDYGVGGGRHAPVVLKAAEALSTTSILDYGCGKGYLGRSLPFPIWEYDPAIQGKDESPRAADLVACIDVLEHVEPERLKFVIDDLHRVTNKMGYFVIHTGPSGKTLPDGRNAHLIQQPIGWWKEQLSETFDVKSEINKSPVWILLVTPKPRGKMRVIAA